VEAFDHPAAFVMVAILRPEFFAAGVEDA